MKFWMIPLGIMIGFTIFVVGISVFLSIANYVESIFV